MRCELEYQSVPAQSDYRGLKRCYNIKVLLKYIRVTFAQQVTELLQEQGEREKKETTQKRAT